MASSHSHSSYPGSGQDAVMARLVTAKSPSPELPPMEERLRIGSGEVGEGEENKAISLPEHILLSLDGFISSLTPCRPSQRSFQMLPCVCVTGDWDRGIVVQSLEG